MKWRPTMQLCYLAARVSLTIGLLATGLSKAISGYPSDVWVSRELYWAIAIAELAIAALIWTRHVALGAWLVMLGSCAAGAYLSLVGKPESCGCFGAWRVAQQWHILIVAAIGMLSLVVLTSNPLRRQGTEALQSAQIPE